MNKSLLSDIQPVGGISFKEKYIEKGDGYECCIHIYKFPNKVRKYWLNEIMNKDNVIATLDVGNYSHNELYKDLNKSLAEQEDRTYSDRSPMGRKRALINYQNLDYLAQSIEVNGEKMKEIHLKLFVYAKTKKELDDNVNKVMSSLESMNFRGNVNLAEQKFDWQSLTTSINGQKKLKNKRKPNVIPASSIAGGYPFYHTYLEDPTGLFLGTTKTYGSVLFDPFFLDDIRTYYNGAVIGVMGSGKSTFLKKLLLNNTILGNATRVIDPTGEFRTLVESLGGKVISLDGTGGIINPLEILATIINEETNEVDDNNSFTMHMSKMSMLYTYMSPNSGDNEKKEFNKLLRDFYEDFGIERGKSTRYQKEEYPIMSDFLSFLNKRLYFDLHKKIIDKRLSEENKYRIENIILTIESLVYDYGSMFNGHSTISNIKDENIVSFEIKDLTEMDRNIFNVQLFNALTLLWNNALTQGRKEKELFENREKSFNNIKRYMIILDEAHRVININNMQGVEYLTNCEREFRKYFGGLWFATQSIRDVASNDVSSIEFEKIKKLFELTQYKCVMRQDPASQSVMSSVFQGLITDSELEKIPNLRKGEMILAINGYGNIELEVHASDEELKLFKGGA